jgi:hypothetical protein
MIRRYTNAILEAIERGSLSWEQVAKECLVFMIEHDVEEMNRIAKFVSLGVAEGFFRCDDGSGKRDIEAASAREAAEEYVRGGDYDPSDGTIFVSVDTENHEGSEEQVTVVLNPPEPECLDQYSHDWRRDSVQGNGGGVIQVDECRWCGSLRTTNTWATNPDDGSQGHRTIGYSAARDDFMPRALGRYPFTTVRIGDGDRVRLDWIHYTVRSDEDQVCGWTAVRDHDGAEFPLASIGTWESWKEAHVREPEPQQSEAE